MQEEQKSTYIHTVMHVVKAHAGAGMFSMGFAMKSTGLIVGSVLTPAIGLIVLHTYYILLNVTDTLWDKVEMTSVNLNEEEMAEEKFNLQNYCWIAERVIELSSIERIRKFSKFMKNLIIGLTYAMTLGFCCIYLVFAASNFKQVVDPYQTMSVRMWLCIIILPMYFASLLPSLKFLSIVSTAGNLLLFIGIVITMYFITDDLPSNTKLNYDVNWMEFPIYFCITIFAYACITVLLPLRAEMKKPELYTKPYGVLNLGFGFTIVVIAMLGILSYIKYGEDIKSSVTLNFPNNWLGITTQVVVTISVLVTYPINIYIPVNIVWSDIDSKYGPFKHPKLIITLFRTLLVLITFLAALSIPYIDLLMSLVAAIASTTLTFIIPPILEMLIIYSPNKRLYIKVYYWIKNILLLLLGALVFILGTATTIMKLIHAIRKETVMFEFDS